MTFDYKILTDSNPATLATLVKAELALGWKLGGGVTLAIQADNTKFYSQSLIKVTV